MVFTELFDKAKELVIQVDDITFKSYLVPDYRYVLLLEDLTAENVTDFPGLTNDMIAEALKLEVEMRNIRIDKAPILLDWFASVITSTVEPGITQTQNELLQNVMNYMQLNESLKDREKELDNKQKRLDKKETIKQLVPGMNFSKAKP